MDENILYQALSEHEAAINRLIERQNAFDGMVKAIREKAEGVEHLIYDEVLNPAKEAMNEAIYNAGLEDFKSRYNDTLGGYNEQLRAIEGEDFDIMKQAYDDYKALGSDYDEGQYVGELIKTIEEQLKNIREKLGIGPEAEVKVEQENGETKVEVDGEDVTEELESKVEPEEAKPEETKPKAVEPEKVEAQPVEEEVTDKIVEDEPEESDPEDLKKLEEELLAYAK